MGQQNIKNAVNIFLESIFGLFLFLALGVKKDDALGATFRNVLVLALLSVGKAVAFLKRLLEVGCIGFAVSRANNANATCILKQRVW